MSQLSSFFTHLSFIMGSLFSFFNRRIPPLLNAWEDPPPESGIYAKKAVVRIEVLKSVL